MNTTDPTLPNYTRAAAVEADGELALLHDLLGGTKRMHAQSATYVKKWPDEEPAVYDRRRVCETFFDGIGRTLSAATGMLFAKPPVLEWNASETALSPMWDNIDAAGTKGTVFTKRFGEAALRDGLALILVDHPKVPTDPETGEPVRITAASEAEYNLRPRWAIYARRSVLNWQAGLVNNLTAPTLIVLQESADVPMGAFGIKTVQRFRELRLLLTPDGYQAAWQLWEQVADDAKKSESFTVVDQGVFKNRNGETARELPVAIAYTGRTDAMLTATIPLMGVAYANLAHWQNASNLRFNREICAFEQLVITGDIMEDAQKRKRIKIGPLVGIHLAQGGTAAWMGPSGNGLDQLKQAVQEKLTEMAQQGVSFLATDTRAAETAEAKRLDATAENSTLATAAQGIEDAVNAALEITAWYQGIEKTGAPMLTISRDYESTGMPPQLLTAYVGAIANAGLPVRLLLNAMQTGGLIGTDEDLDALEGEILTNQAAIADDAAMQAATLAERAAPPPPETPAPRPRRFAVERDDAGRAIGIAEAA